MMANVLSVTIGSTALRSGECDDIALGCDIASKGRVQRDSGLSCRT